MASINPHYSWGKQSSSKASRVDAAIASGSSNFVLDLSKFQAKSVKMLSLVPRMVAMMLYRNITAKTPVDTGRARNNWMLSVGQPDLSTTEASSNNSEELFALGGKAVAKLKNHKPGQSIFITNSLPYIMRLEYGYSDQAPHGMVRVSIAEIGKQIPMAVSEAAKEV